MLTSDESYLARAVGMGCAALQGLHTVQLPPGLSRAFAEQVVRTANVTRPAAPSFAILVGQDDEVSDPLCPIVRRATAIRYRIDNRLAVLSGSRVDLASFEGAFKSVLSPGFPRQQSAALPLAIITRILVGLLVESLDADISAEAQATPAKKLADALAVLAHAIELGEEGNSSWNVQWFSHVDEGMRTLQRAIAMEGEPELSLDDAFDRYLWASFGLPRPTSKRSWKPDTVRAFVTALKDRWSDEDQIKVTTAQLAQIDDTAEWGAMDWTGFDVARARLGSTLGALRAVTGNPHNLRAWTRMNRELFEQVITSGGSIRVTDESGSDLALSPGAPSPVILRSITTGKPDLTEPVVVHVPLIRQPGNLPLDGLSLAPSRVRMSFKPISRRIEKDSIAVTGQIESNASSSHRRPLSFRLSAQLKSSDDPLAGFVDLDASTEMVLIRSEFGVLSFRVVGSDRFGRASYSGPDTQGAPAQSYGDELSLGKHFVVAWDEQPPEPDGILLRERPERPGIHFGTLTSGGSAEISFGASTVRLHSTEPMRGQQTYLTAAITNDEVDPSDPPVGELYSIRGQLESAYAFLASGSPASGALGHIVLTPDKADLSSFEDPNAHGLLWPRGRYSQWQRLDNPLPTKDVVASKEAGEFAVTFQQIWRRSCDENEDGNVDKWVSKRSWAWLWTEEQDLLDQYLRSYAHLLSRASRDTPMTQFWAAFPFSASIWDREECVGVLVSPLHPLRLAWLASVEATLAVAENSAKLAGVVEGWQFPLVGPGPTPLGRVLAFPADTGSGQIFAGWSLLLPISPNASQSVRVPDRIAGLQGPGVSPSGLTAAAAGAALDDFWRNNPHLPSLTVDLAATQPSSRLDEIDQAVLVGISRVSGATGGRGLRVLDSLLRRGDIPREDIHEKLVGAPAAPAVTWSRYNPHMNKSPRSNLRLLQDSGVQFRTEPADALSSSDGGHAVGRVPLRRMHSPESTNGNESYMLPTVKPTGWDALDFALEAVETLRGEVSLAMKLSPSYLIDAGADWTVSGEAYLSSSALSRLVSRHGSGNKQVDRILWEWRPPFLDGDSGRLQRRPYVVIARVSPALRNSLAKKLAVVSGVEDDQVSTLCDRVLESLGTRGIGLSSLVARGGTHESGAIGFFCAYELLDLAKEEESRDVVLPIDSCSRFLTALGASSEDEHKRADLLLVRITQGSLTFVPIEIKLHGGAAGAGGPLPRPGSGLQGAASQAQATAKALQAMIDERAQRWEPQSDLLWATALGALVEGGLQLTGGPRSHPDDASILRNLASGSTRLHVGHPLVVFLQHGLGQDGEYYIQRDQPGGNYLVGALVARPQLAFRAVKDSAGNDRFLSEWRNLVAWAAQPPSSESEASPLRPAEAGLVGPSEADKEAARDKLMSAHNHPSAYVREPQVLDTDLEAPTSGPPRRALVESSDQPVAPVSEPFVPLAGAADPLGTIKGDGVRFSVGAYTDTIKKANAYYWPSNTRLTQMNIGVVGDLGTGKTQLVQALVTQLRLKAAECQPSPLNTFIIDYKRDFQSDDFLQLIGGQVLKPRNIPLNPLALSEPYSAVAAYKKATDFCDVLQRIYSGIGHVQRERLITTITGEYAKHPDTPPTLSEVLKAYRMGGQADSVTSILMSFCFPEVFIEHRGETVPFANLIEDSVTVLALNEMGSDQNGKNALVALFLNQFYEYMLGLEKWPFEGNGPQLRRLNSMLVVDEAVNIMKYDFEVLMNLLLQGREFGVGVLLSSQYLSHFQQKNDWSEPLLTWFIHRVPYVTPKDLGKIGIKADQALADGVQHLPVHHALYKSLDTPGLVIRGTPFYELRAEIAD